MKYDYEWSSTKKINKNMNIFLICFFFSTGKHRYLQIIFVFWTLWIQFESMFVWKLLRIEFYSLFAQSLLSEFWMEFNQFCNTSSITWNVHFYWFIRGSCTFQDWWCKDVAVQLRRYLRFSSTGRVLWLAHATAFNQNIILARQCYWSQWNDQE